MRTKQPEGTRIKLVKSENAYTREPRYWPFRGGTKDELARKVVFNTDRSQKIIRTDIFEVQKGRFELVEENIQDEAGERGAASAKHQDIYFPESLTERDKELIVEQCENQVATSKEQIEGFIAAYSLAKFSVQTKQGYKGLYNVLGYSWSNFTKDDQLDKVFLEFIVELAEYIEPQNKKGYRKTPASFKNLSVAVEPQYIENAMQAFAEAYVEGRLTPDEAYKEFEKIHPFEDGNGRVGDLLWRMAMARDTGKWPETLPPDIFGEKNVLEKYKRRKEPEEGQFLSMAEKRRYEYQMAENMKAPVNTTSAEGRAEILFDAVVVGGPNAVELQEARGTTSFIESDTLPVTMGPVAGYEEHGPEGTMAVLEAMGVEFMGLVENDPVFQYVKLPEGWSKKPGWDPRLSLLVDENGRERASIFYKAASYDRKAILNLLQRFGTITDPEGFDSILGALGDTENDVEIRVKIMDGTHMSGDGEPIHIIESTIPAGGDKLERYQIIKKAKQEATDWLDMYYPYWRDIQISWIRA